MLRQEPSVNLLSTELRAVDVLPQNSLSPTETNEWTNVKQQDTKLKTDNESDERTSTHRKRTGESLYMAQQNTLD